MSNQIVISSGAKVRNLDGVLTGSTGIVGSVPLGAANGVATLDALGKVPLSQLPASVVTYLGTWNAATNTPTLANGTGDTGDLYICNVAGTVNFGAGPITFSVGDWVIYSGTTWERSAGSTGTVTSVAVTESGDALSITGSPITTAGTINIGFAGTSGQYINGAGGLTTFPSLTGFVPYTGATANVDLGTFDLTADVITGATGSFTSSGGSNTFSINHSSGSGIALNITKGGNGEGLYINKTSGSGNAATINGDVQINSGTLTGTSIILSQDLYLENNKYIYAKKSTGATSYNIIGINLSDQVSIDASGLGAVFGGSIRGTSIYSEGALSGAGEIHLKQNVAFTNPTGYSTISGITNGFVLFASGKSVTLSNVNITTPRTISFPDAAGTLALTSDLSGYVTLGTTQIISGLKTFTALATNNEAVGIKLTTGVVSTEGYLTLNAKVVGTLHSLFLAPDSTSNRAELTFDNTALRTYALPNASGTFALLSGTQTFTGKLIVNTSGIDNQIVAVGTAPSVRLANAVSGATINGFIAMAGSTNDYITGAVAGDMCIGNQNSGKIIYGFGSGTATAFMTITSTGLGIGTSSPSGALHISGSGYTSSRIYLQRTSGAIGTYSMGVQSSDNTFGIVDEGQGNITRILIGSQGFTASVKSANDADSKTFMNSIGSDCGIIPIPAGTTLYCYNRSGGTNYRVLLTSSTYFTGQHGNNPINMDLKTNIEEYVGLIVSSVGTYYAVNPITQEVTTGKDAITISQALPQIKLTDTDKDKAVWGVVTNVANDNFNPDGTTEYDNAATFGDRLGSNVVRINSLGEGAIWVTNINGNIENGDYICSSIIDGYGRKQDDDMLHNYSVAKSTMDCEFDLNNDNLYRCEEFEYNGQTYKKAFIGCTYHCG